jgi:hypothetical protein
LGRIEGRCTCIGANGDEPLALEQAWLFVAMADRDSGVRLDFGVPEGGTYLRR